MPKCDFLAVLLVSANPKSIILIGEDFYFELNRIFAHFRSQCMTPSP